MVTIDYLVSFRWDFGIVSDRKLQVKRGAIVILGEPVQWDEHLKWWLSYMVDFGQVPSWGFE